ncbi:glycoside hydrolase superfamily [Cladochytrium replicatum]|nr:glycoside hydrolase superfamily [Cladochytrium replicatum]
MSGKDPKNDDDWWRTAVIYQVYPRSFADSNGDGVGDLRGIISKLDYLCWLGVDAVWLSPIFKSPMADFGYDISSYREPDALFGTLEDVDELIRTAHAKGLRIILDLVPNHTSDEHEWFIKSREGGKDGNPYRDFYMWRDPKPDGSRPNNWLSYFGGPAWQFDEKSKQYYLTLFDPKQVDLNWRNPKVREEIYDIMRFWFAKGVDGYRIDVLNHLFKHPDLIDNPPNPDWDPKRDASSTQFLRINDNDQPEMRDVCRDMRTVADSFPGRRVLIGEIYLPFSQLVRYYGEKKPGASDYDGIHIPFNFSLVVSKGWGAKRVREIVEEYESHLPEGAAGSWVLGNHDQNRIASKIGRRQSKAAHVLLLTLKGSPTVYYGDELGMENGVIPLEKIQDPQGIRDGAQFSRDLERTPMQWNGDVSSNAGFCPPSLEPWLPISHPETLSQINVETQQSDAKSMANLIRKLLGTRKTVPALRFGTYTTLQTAGSDNVFGYTRQWNGTSVIVLLNFSGVESTVAIEDATSATAKLLVSSEMDLAEGSVFNLENVALRGYEGLVLLAV